MVSSKPATQRGLTVSGMLRYLFPLLKMLHSLKNHGADQEVSDMFDMGAQTMALPLDPRGKDGV